MSPNCTCQPGLRRGDGFFATIFKLLMVYVLLVFAGGTLANTGHPVAVETGKLIRTVMLVDPAIRYAAKHDMDQVAEGLTFLANGIPPERLNVR